MTAPRPAAAAAPLALSLAFALSVAVLATAGDATTRAQDPPAPQGAPGGAAPEQGMDDGKPPAPADAAPAAADGPVTLLYTIHNAGYIEPCG